MYLFFLALLCFISFLHWFTNCRERARTFYQIPGPQGSFIVGNCLQVVASPAQLFLTLRKWANTYSDLYRQWIHPYGVVNIYNPNDIEIIISNPKYNEKSLLYAFLRPWLRDGLLLSKDFKWQTRRKILTPAFHFNILSNFTKLLDENSKRLVNNLEGEVGKDDTDIIPIISDFTLNSICETSMGKKLNEDISGKGKVYKNAIHEMGKLIVYRIARSWLAFDCLFDMTDAGRKQKEVLNIIHNFPKQIISDRREYISKHGFTIPTNDDLTEDDVMGALKRRMAMLDLLISAENEGLISEEGIQEEVDTFMFEGHDTTAMGLTYLMMELANNKDIQDKVFLEVQQLFGQSRRTATMQDLNNLKYLENCIKETLRLYPPVPFISRVLTEDVTLSGHFVPGGKTLCHIHIFDLHRRADLYESPLTFKPERFSIENSANRHPYAYIPFSAGPRNCIGQRFAMLELKCAIAGVVRAFELQPGTLRNNLQFTTDLVLRTTHPIHVKFTKRH